MIVAWRLLKRKRLAEALSGEGARLAGGRWNRTGIPVVYASETISLAVLELFVHLTRKDMEITKSLMTIPIMIPDDLARSEISLDDLKPGWDSSPPYEATQALGTKWATDGVSAVLRVPSAIIPEEHNFVINPRHPDFPLIAVGNARTFSLDRRVWK